MERPSPENDGARQWQNLLVLGIVLVVVVVTVALMLMLKHGIEREDCFAANHHNCAPIDAK